MQTSEGDAIDDLVADWKQAEMIEDYKATGTRWSSRSSTCVTVCGGGEPSEVHLRGTNFQLKVWEALLQIPHWDGDHLRGIAERIGRPGAIRVPVGTAVGHNPIAVLIPCHRVIRKMRRRLEIIVTAR
ncbi:MAG: MGMT family protein [Candidatus Moduliflexus flocculans]|nr:MGMT family protein [Candidatus Moduliflexus flocculans]